jgi:hypothetical protein
MFVIGSAMPTAVPVSVPIITEVLPSFSNPDNNQVTRSSSTVSTDLIVRTYEMTITVDP